MWLRHVAVGCPGLGACLMLIAIEAWHTVPTVTIHALALLKIVRTASIVVARASGIGWQAAIDIPLRKVWHVVAG